MFRLRALLGVLLVIGFYACTDPSSVSVEPQLGKGGGGNGETGPIDVLATDPSEATQDTTLVVRIFGDGFERGVEARFLRGGAATGDITTNRTKFISTTELEADVTVAVDAVVDLYDVEVFSSGGRRRGVGTELFRVEEKKNGAETGQVVTLFEDVGTSSLSNDGEGGYVTDRDVGVESEITLDGRHWFVADGPREICISFPTGADAQILREADWNELVALSGGAVDLGLTYCGITTMHTRDHSNPDKMPGADADPNTPDRLDVHASGGKLVIKEFDDKFTEWQWRLMFDDGKGGGARDNGVCVRRQPDDSWTVSNDRSLAVGSEDPSACDDVDEWVDLWRFYQNKSPKIPSEWRHVARFRMPFSYRVIPLF